MSRMTTYERAIQIYQVLIAAAHNRQTVTYPLLGDAIGVPARGLAGHLELIQRHCETQGLPPLTVLAVQAGTGQPGSGYRPAEDVDRDREGVYKHNWFGMAPVTAEVLRELADAR